MGYRKKHWFCSLLAALCLLSALPRMESLARVAVETDKKCTLSITMTLNQPEGNWEDLKKAEVKVDVCRIASMDAVGAYTPEGEFDTQPLKDALKDLNQDPRKVTGDFWKTQAEAAAGIFKEQYAADDIEHTGTNSIWTVSVKDGSGIQKELPVGLYLVFPREVKTDAYRYTFEPYLVSLPTNNYGTIQGDNTTPSEDDRWIYDVSVGLKPEQHIRYGDLVLRKALEKHNASLGPAVFVFRVEGMKDMDGNGTEETVYSNVHTLSFTEAGSQELTIAKLPAGTRVTVEEIYAGSAYQAGTPKPAPVIIRARDAYDASQPESDPQPGAGGAAEISFSNSYTGGLTPGSGITNHFTYETNSGNTGGTGGTGETGQSGAWKWEQIVHRLSENYAADGEE